MNRIAQRIRRTTRPLAAALVLPLLVMVPVAPAQAQTDGGAVEWSVSPVARDGDADRVSLRHTIDPGGVVEDAIAVTNLGDAPADFGVLAGDGIVGESGAFDIAAGAPVDSGRWIAFGGLDGGRLTLDPGETREVPVRIVVPADAVPGDHPAGIVVGVTTGDDASSVTNRIGVRAHLRVAGEVSAQLAVRDLTTSFTPSWLPFAPGTLRVDYTVANAGNVRLGAADIVRVEGPFGLGAAEAAADTVELLPGAEIVRSVEIAAPSLLLLSGTLRVAPVVVAADEVVAPATTEAGLMAFAPSWTGLALILLVLAAIALLVVRRRRQRSASTKPVDEPADSPREPQPVG